MHAHQRYFKPYSWREIDIINCADFQQELKKNGINFYAGVPDSLLKDYCAFVSSNEEGHRHIIAANEGNALALAAGHHLATGEIGLVYMQNSGLGNVVNPLMSLADPLVYSIPALLLIGWRGKPGVKDEPQHAKQGQVTLKLLEAMEVEYAILPENIEGARKTLTEAVSYMKANNAPYALVVPPGTFASYDDSKCQEFKDEKGNYDSLLTREEALKVLIPLLADTDVVVSTTGKTSREIFEYREEYAQGHQQDFLTVGSMGHSSQIALGMALARPERNIYCIDGDGSFLMHMGALATNGAISPHNLKHIVINNGAHESVGGQPTVAESIDIPGIARACGYQEVYQAQTEEEILAGTRGLKLASAPSLLEIKVKVGARSNLGRPTTSPIENKEQLMKFLNCQEM